MLKGHFEPTFLASILQLLCNEKKSGVLRLMDEHNEVKIYLHDGAVIHAVGSRREMRLGELLRAKGAISAKQLQRAVLLATEKNQALGKTLVMEGYITIDLLKRIVREQAETVIYNVFLWQKGTFEYKDATFNLRGTMLTQLNIMNLILEASRRIDEIGEIRTQIPDEGAVLRLARPTQAAGEASFTTNEWRLLSLIDGIRSLRAVIDESLLDDYTAYLLLKRLLNSGIVELGAPQPRGAPHPSDALEAMLAAYRLLLQQVLSCLREKVAQLPYLFLHEPADRNAASLAPSARSALHAHNVHQWSQALLQDCLSAAGAPPQLLMALLDIDAPAGAVLPALDDGVDLLGGMGECFSTLLQRVPPLFGCEATREVLQRVGDALIQLDSLPMPAGELNLLRTNIKSILVNVELRLGERSIREVKPIGLFAMVP
jgi:hypothetical protein